MSAIYYPQQFVIKDIDDNGVAKVSTGSKLIITTDGERFGGMGWHEQERPIKTLLTRKEKKELASAERLYKKGFLVELQKRYGTTDIETIRKLIFKRTIGTTRTQVLFNCKNTGIVAAGFLRLEKTLPK